MSSYNFDNFATNGKNRILRSSLFPLIKSNIGSWLATWLWRGNLFIFFCASIYGALSYRALASDGGPFAFMTIANQYFYIPPPNLRFLHSAFQIPTILATHIFSGDSALKIAVQTFCWTYELVPWLFLAAIFFLLRRNGQLKYFSFFVLAHLISNTIHDAIPTNAVVETIGLFWLLMATYFFESNESHRKNFIKLYSLGLLFSYETGILLIVFLAMLSLYRYKIEKKASEKYFFLLFLKVLLLFTLLFLFFVAPGYSESQGTSILKRFESFEEPYLILATGMLLLFAFFTVFSKPLSIMKVEMGIVLVWTIPIACFFLIPENSFYVYDVFESRVWATPFAVLIAALFYFAILKKKKDFLSHKFITLMAFCLLTVANISSFQRISNWKGLMDFIRQEVSQHQGCHFVSPNEYQEKYSVWSAYTDHISIYSILMQGKRRPETLLATWDSTLPFSPDSNTCAEISKSSTAKMPRGLTVWLLAHPPFFDFSALVPWFEDYKRNGM